MKPPESWRPGRLAGALLPIVFFILLAMAVLVVAWPFMPSLAWALLIGYVTWPLQVRLARAIGGRRSLSAGLLSLLVAMLVMAPLVFAAWTAQAEARLLYDRVQEFMASPPQVPDMVAALPGIGTWLQHLRDQWLAQPDVVTSRTADWLQGRLGDLASAAGLAGRNLGKLAMALFALFFVYRDGEAIAMQVRTVLTRIIGPRVDDYLEAAAVTTRAVLLGLLATAIAQGLLAGVSYWVAGMPAPILLAVATAVFALIPFGAPIVWGTAGMWLLFNGQLVPGLGVLIWGVVVVSQIDNIVRPIVISASTRISFLLVLIGVLGGLLAFGLIGIFLGPIVLAISMAVWREWATSPEGVDVSKS